jgi:glycerol uptake facilitator protein
MQAYLQPFLGECLGTMVLITLGDGVVAGAVLNKSKSKDGGWIVITAGWAFAVVFGVFIAKAFGSADAHLNPAVTIGFGILGNDYSKLFYIPAQILGAFLGAILVYLHYLPHWKEANSKESILAVFSTDPAIHKPMSNFFSESLGTFLLILGIHSIFLPTTPMMQPQFGVFLVGLLVWSLGLSMGGTTGYAINPARDLGPRLAHSLLPIFGKGNSNWGYAWIPICAPIMGAILAAFAIRFLTQ